MRFVSSFSLALTAGVVSFAAQPAAEAQSVGDIQISVTNQGNSDFFITPAWVAFQNGGFDFFDVGSAASASLEALAEDGIVDGLVADFAASGQPGNRQGVAANPAGFPGAPVIDPGETASAFITPINPAAYQYLSFASMIIPSNDAFIGNDDPTAYRVFDNDGSIFGGGDSVIFNIFASDIYDAGTEVNDTLGAAFSTVGGTSSDENGVITGNPDLSNFIGTSTPAGTTINDLFTGDEVVATIEVSFVDSTNPVVPTPATLPMGLIGLGALILKRRRQKL